MVALKSPIAFAKSVRMRSSQSLTRPLKYARPSKGYYMRRKLSLVLLVSAAKVCAQEQTDSDKMMQQILQRLDSLEKENRELVQEVRSLRDQLTAAPEQRVRAPAAEQPQASPEERVKVNEDRISELAQTKVESSQKFPIQLNGMLLFNAFLNSRATNANAYADYGLLSGPARAGATVRQTLLGFDFQGPKLPGDGRVNGSLIMDFWAG